MSHTIHCPLCDQATTNPTSDDPLAEAERIKNLIDRLVEQRAALLRRLNNQKSLTRNLPTEIIFTILRLACQPSDFFNPNKPAGISPASPFVLGTVSSYWRDIVTKSTPPLWTFVTVRAEVNNNNVYQVVSLLRHYFRSYGHLGLTVELDFEAQMEVNDNIRDRRREMERCHRKAYGYDSDYDGAKDFLGDDTELEEPLLPVRDVIFREYPEQIKTLHWINPPPVWLGSTMPSTPYLTWKNLINLEAIHLIWKGPSQVETDGRKWKFEAGLEDAPKLQELFLHAASNMRSYYEDIPIALYSKNITDLYLSKVPYDICLYLLISCDNLRSFSMMQPLYPSSFSELVASGNIASKTKLETLEWTFCSYRELGLLSVLAFPSIRTVIFHDMWDWHGTPAPDLESILNQLPISCQSFLIGVNSHYNTDKLGKGVTMLQIMAEFIQHIPDTVTQIGLRGPCIGLASIIERQNLQTSLTKVSKISVIKDRRNWKNKNGRINTPICIDCQDSNLFKSLEFIKSMKAKFSLLGAGSSFCFEYDTDCAVINWDVGDKEELKELVTRGLDLYIFEDEKLVDWL